jgi:hypothetical protein
VREHPTRGIEIAGARATAAEPLAWLRFETFETELPAGLALTE